MFRELKNYPSVIAAMTTCILLSCGTRVGNPKKPSDNGNQFIKLPRIDVEIPANDLDETTTASLSLTQGNSDAVSSGVPSGNVSVGSFNELVDKLNEGEITLGTTITVQAGDQTVKGAIQLSTDSTYKYAATFCTDNLPFIFARWTEDHNAVFAVRHIDRTPFEENRDKHKKDGTSVKQEIVWKKEAPLQLSLWQSRIPPTRPSIIKLPSKIIEAFKFRISPQGVAEFTGVSDLRYDTDKDDGNFIADVRVAGQVRPDKKHFYLSHIANFKLICKPEFDEDNQKNPGWCLGLRRRNLEKNDYAFMNQSEINNAWNLMDDLDLTMEADLKEVDFPADAICPK